MDLLLNTIIPFIGQAAAGEGSGMGMQLLIFAALFGGMWFLLIAPQRKKQKKHAQMLSQLTTGDCVITNGGIYGVITNVKEDRFVVKIADNTKIEVNKAFLQNKVEEKK
ncbi:MAG: preprotein translocase subunit YajC [Verrucomicrobia bacterium CG_4_10_14_3_um_filter_43_23]|nr:MAG: preprotein translocase subunit YajC [Verrucomicrobia bacterium CG1_02_43_26]PIP58871.1 MAG: preprotein translocase subunit YajC [Verrucomicrobia bacterium CG22_combo_CG10-13_8_21_14_all_43_17]PIX57816.1 MAG: preprotein translocase subunit YajC [Verrucomicrobia bacterium CG_4_10_14_3_um_filter_43_23]PIY62077.1 MAG: preprotein translocase subunit YajC [Verrucomicrobia bacterium CG_4_10_14_0_8_um_filter_43_34]PJA44924.1 MAG: preprotein translocase subunit YajC [Verrucomicrobia bacterium CG